ncbi:MAG TPA: hypothetical protein VF278_20395 [Pirellulales bacterium]
MKLECAFGGEQLSDLDAVHGKCYLFYMGTSFVTIDGEHGFWMRDGILELWLRLLALHLPEPNTYNSEEVHRVTREIRDRWLLASKGVFSGCVPDYLKEAISTPDGKTVVDAAIGSLRSALERQEATISKNVLNLLAIEGVWRQDFEARRLIEVADAFVELMEGKVADTVQSTDRMPGCR